MTNQTSNKSTINHLDDMSFSSIQVIAWSCALTTEVVVIAVRNLLTIVLFAISKKLRSKKSLYLVLNMAFADLFLGGICLPIYVYSLALGQVKFDKQTPTLFTIIFLLFAQASFVTAALISCERLILRHLLAAEAPADTFYANIQLRYILTVWTSSILSSLFTVFLLQFSSLVALNSFLSLFLVSVLLITSGLNFGVWRNLQQQTVPRSSPKQSLAKTTLNEDFVISISHRLGFLASTFGLQLDSLSWI